MGNQLRSVNLKFVTALVISSALLSACQGQNPFKRESNPVKNYPHSMESGNQPYVPGQKPAVAPKGPSVDAGKVAPAAPPCFEPVKIEVDPNHGNLLLKFSEETETSYNLKITLNGPQAAKGEVKADRPENSEFRLIARQDNTLTYKFTWKPAKGEAAQTPAETLIVGLDGQPAPGACAGAKNRLTLNVVVSKAGNVPSVSFQEVKEKISYGDKFDFKVIVDDSTASKAKTPTISFEGSAALYKCEESKALSETKYEFLCHFDSTALKGVEKMLNSGKEASTSFSVTATSRAGVSSAATPQKIKVMFEVQTKPTQTKSTPLPPPRPVEFAAQGAKK